MEANALWNMMELTVLNIRVDETFEPQILGLSTANLEALELIVCKRCATRDPRQTSNLPVPYHSRALYSTANGCSGHENNSNGPVVC